MSINWCKSCNVPIIKKSSCSCGMTTVRLATDVRPVFPQERYLLFLLTHNDEYLSKSEWVAKGYRYILDGQPVKEPLTDFMKEADLGDVRRKLETASFDALERAFSNEMERFVKVNTDHIQQLTYAAQYSIKEATAEYERFLPVVSFSGGKDSTVVSDLVTSALSNPSILHLFGDTTLEFPLTHDYVKRFRRRHSKTLSLRRAPTMILCLCVKK